MARGRSASSAQTGLLLAAVTAFLLSVVAVTWFISLLYSNFNPEYKSPSAWRWVVSLVVAIFVTKHGLQKKSLSQSGAAAGLIVGFILSISCMRFLACLLAFFFSASKATRYQAEKKIKFEADFKEGGQRNWIQVISNGGPAAVLAIFYMWEVGSVDVPVDFSKSFSASWYALSVMSAMASSCGDTCASEVGSACGTKDPVHILTWKRVPRGTNGGISLIGTFSSIFGGFIVGTAFYLTELLIISRVVLSESPPQWPLILFGAFAGFFGSMIDSLLGATLQYSGKHSKLGYILEFKSPEVEHISGRQILDNHSVNLLSSLVTGLIMPYIAVQTWPLF